MNSFSIYKNSLGGVEAIKRGWNWPAFFFTWIWAFIKGLYGLGIGVILSVIVLNIITTLVTNEAPGLGIFLSLAFFIIPFWLGAKGNEYVENKLKNKGYDFAGIKEGNSQDDAAASFLKYSQVNDETNISPDNKWDLKCTQCGHLYRVGEDATIVTMEDVFDSASSVLVFGSGNSVQKDLVASMSGWADDRLKDGQASARNNIQRIRKGLAKGQVRYWYCKTCNNEESAFEYPKIWK
jgi:hypothetical protein